MGKKDKATFKMATESAEKRKSQKAVFSKRKIKESMKKRENDRRHREFDKPFDMFGGN